jgi:hypothetical protein
MTHGVNGMFTNGLAGEALDLDGASSEAGRELDERGIDPAADLDNPRRDSDGTPVGPADAEADAAPNGDTST